jgi:hypothetical protein
MVEGTWAFRDDGPSVIRIYGQWSWMNGLSPTDDFRRMVLHVSGPMVKVPSSGRPMRWSDGEELYRPFFGIDELVKVAPEEFKSGLRELEAANAAEPAPPAP